MADGSAMRVKQIAKKEIVEFSRDWRTIIAIIVIPLLMFPLLFILFPVLLQSEAAELQSLELELTIQTDNMPNNLSAIINQSSIQITYEELPVLDDLSQPGDDLEKLRDGSVDAVLRITMEEDIWYYSILHMSTSEQSREAKSRLLYDLNEWENDETAARIEAGGLDVNSTLDP
ncbi:MAG: hypothetical protein CXT70_03220, partial [Methanobacteriota archaeon]